MPCHRATPFCKFKNENGRILQYRCNLGETAAFVKLLCWPFLEEWFMDENLVVNGFSAFVNSKYCALLPNFPGTNLPISEGWSAWLGRSDGRTINRVSRSALLATARHATKKTCAVHCDQSDGRHYPAQPIS